MPNYNAQVPPYSIFPGDVALAFNAEAPAAGQASQQFALPSYAGFPENGRTIRWQISFATAPTVREHPAANRDQRRGCTVRGAYGGGKHEFDADRGR